MKRVQFPQDFFCTQTWPPSHCFVHKYGRRDVMWKRSIVIQWRKESIFSGWKLLQSFSPPKSTPFGWSIPLWSTIGRAHFGGCTCGYQSLPTSILIGFCFLRECFGIVMFNAVITWGCLVWLTIFSCREICFVYFFVFCFAQMHALFSCLLSAPAFMD